MIVDWQGILKQTAPWVAAAASGPAGLIGMAAAQLTTYLGAEVKPTAESISAAIAGATPEQMIALKNADNDFALKMQQMGFQDIETLEALGVSDRKDARAMQISTRSRVPATLSLIVTLGYFSILVGMMLGGLKVSDSQALLLMLGSLSTAWGAVMAYWFGTTHEGGKKTDLLAKKSS